MDNTANSLTSHLTAIRSRLEKATPGPWKVTHNTYVGFVGQSFFSVIGGHPDVDGDYTAITGGGRVQLENAELIAHAPTDIAKLLRAVELLREQRDGYHSMAQAPFSLDEDDAELAKIFAPEEGE